MPHFGSVSGRISSESTAARASAAREGCGRQASVSDKLKNRYIRPAADWQSPPTNRSFP
jgi:hypothetical protein